MSKYIVKTNNRYINIDLFNNHIGKKAIQAEQSINYSTPLFTSSVNSTIAIEKASLPLDDLPFFNMNERNLIITVDKNGVSQSMNVKNKFIEGSYLNNGNVFDIQRVLDAVNQCLLALYTSFANEDRGLAPSIRLNSASERFEMLLPLTAISQSGTTFNENYNIWFNNELYQMFAGFPCYLESSDYSINKLFKLTPFNYNHSTYTHVKNGVAGNVDCFLIPQEFSSVSNWSDVDTIIVSTNIPILGEALGSFSAGGGSGSESLSILTDLSLNPGNFLGSRNDVLVAPNYRREINLMDAGSINRITIKLYYRTKKGALKELMIPYGSHMSLKLVVSQTEVSGG